MRILLSCLQSDHAHPVPSYKYWKTYFVGGIEEGGHSWDEVPGVDWAEGLLYQHDRSRAASWRAHVWEKTVERIRNDSFAARPDIFLSYLYPWMVDEGAVREIRRLGVPCVNYFCDNVREFVRAPDDYRAFDLNWVPELAATRFYARDRVPFIHAAMPTWIRPELRTWNHQEQFGVTFIGSRDSLREALLADAIQLGAPIELAGSGWPLNRPQPRRVIAAGARAKQSMKSLLANQLHFLHRYGVVGFGRKFAERFRLHSVNDALLAPHVLPPVGAEEYIVRTQRSRVVLGVNRYPSYRHSARRPDTYSRGRDVEAPMMGACYLTEWTPELAEMYDLGVEIETYRDAAEMVEKIRSLLNDVQRRSRMRQLAQRRALAEHSVPRTIERIADRLGIGAPPRQ